MSKEHRILHAAHIRCEKFSEHIFDNICEYVNDLCPDAYIESLDIEENHALLIYSFPEEYEH